MGILSTFRRDPGDARKELKSAIRSGNARRIDDAAASIVKAETARLIEEALKCQVMLTAQRCVLRWMADEGLADESDLPGLRELLSQNHLPGAFGATEPPHLQKLWAKHVALDAWNEFRENLRTNPDASAPW